MAEEVAFETVLRKVRVKIVVEVTLDPVPGWGNKPEDFRDLIERQMKDSCPWYLVGVSIDATEPIPNPTDLYQHDIKALADELMEEMNRE